MKLHFSTNHQAGTTLMEVLCSAVIMSICASGLMGAVANGFFTIRLAQENQRATQILMEQAEMIRLYNWDQVNQPGFIPTNFIASYDPQNPNNAGVSYTGVVSITAIPFSAAYATNMRMLTLNLKWSSKKVPHTRTITTLVAKDGLQNYVY